MDRVLANSLDPVRHTPSLPDRDERLLHAEVELAVRLLFGDQIVIPEPYSFDSLGFLGLAAKVLEARRSVLQMYPFSESWMQVPFILTLLDINETFLQMVSRRIAKGRNFILSGWPELTDDEPARKELARMLASGDFTTARAAFPSEYEKLTKLEEVNVFFSSNKPYRAGSPREQLSAKIDKVREPIGDPDLDIYVQDLLQGVEAVTIAGFEITDRSRIRQIWQDYMDYFTFQKLIDYVDACYNDVLAESAQTRNSASTSGLLDSSFLISARALTNKLLHPGELGESRRLIVDATSQSHLLTRLVDDWVIIWTIIAQPEWRDSIRQLQTARLPEEVDVARHLHVEFIRSHLKQMELQYENRILTLVSTAVDQAGELYGFEYSEGEAATPSNIQMDETILGQDTSTS